MLWFMKQAKKMLGSGLAFIVGVIVAVLLQAVVSQAAGIEKINLGFEQDLGDKELARLNTLIKGCKNNQGCFIEKMTAEAKKCRANYSEAWKMARPAVRKVLFAECSPLDTAIRRTQCYRDTLEQMEVDVQRLAGLRWQDPQRNSGAILYGDLKKSNHFLAKLVRQACTIFPENDCFDNVIKSVGAELLTASQAMAEAFDRVASWSILANACSENVRPDICIISKGIGGWSTELFGDPNKIPPRNTPIGLQQKGATTQNRPASVEDSPGNNSERLRDIPKLDGAEDPSRLIDCSDEAFTHATFLAADRVDVVRLMGESVVFACMVKAHHANNPAAIVLAQAAVRVAMVVRPEFSDMQSFFKAQPMLAQVQLDLEKLKENPDVPGQAELALLIAHIQNVRNNRGEQVKKARQHAWSYFIGAAKFCAWRAALEAKDPGCTSDFPKTLISCPKLDVAANGESHG